MYFSGGDCSYQHHPRHISLPLLLCSEGTMIFNTRAALSNDCIHDQPLAPPHCLSVAVNVTEGIVFTHNYINPIALVSQLVYVLSYSVIEFLLVQ